jgi:hypothetical protein
MLTNEQNKAAKARLAKIFYWAGRNQPPTKIVKKKLIRILNIYGFHLPKSYYDGNAKKNWNNDWSNSLHQTWLQNGYCLRIVNLLVNNGKPDYDHSWLEWEYVGQNQLKNQKKVSCKDVNIQ